MTLVQKPFIQRGDVRIGNDVWVGDTVTILSGVEIGDGAVVGASSVVTRNVDPYEVVAGNPAKHIRFRFPREVVELLTKLKWWNLTPTQISQISTNLQSVPTKENLLEIQNLINQSTIVEE